MVVFTNGKKDKKEYRRFKIKTIVGPDDYGSMAEILKQKSKTWKFTRFNSIRWRKRSG